MREGLWMKTIFKDLFAKNLPFWIFAGISIFLLIVAFFTPPPYKIDESVIISVSELFAFAALYTVIRAIEKGVGAKVKHKDTEVEIKGKE